MLRRAHIERLPLEVAYDVGILSRAQPTKKLMKDGTLKLDALDYPRINNGCEIIP